MPRGKKTCPECNASVGPRLGTCECGHKFAFKQGSEPKRKREALKLPADREPEALTENPSEVIGVKDRDALRSFIEQLRSCQGDSNGNGGCYSAFLHHDHGVLQVRVQFTMRLR